MKKTMKVAIAASVLAAPAFAANMENPLYIPTTGEIYSKTSVGLMLKVADDSLAHQAKGHAGETEFPIYRATEEIGYGITDRLSVNGTFGYTHDGDIDRKGMHVGRIGLNYRVMENPSNLVWDVYADAHLGGVSAMEGDFTATGFKYDNYSNGRWGFYVGSKVGKTWDKFTGALFAEVLHTFGNDNNEIGISTMSWAPIFGGKDTISVDLKSTTEFNTGLKTFYELNEKWGIGAGFTYKYHAANGVEGLATDYIKGLPLGGGVTSDMVVNQLLSGLTDMEDRFDEFMFTVSGTHTLSDTMQVSVYADYTVDSAEAQAQNGTDVKAEIGARFNVSF